MWRTFHYPLAQLVAQFPEGRTIYCYVQALDTRPVTAYAPPPVISVRYGFEEPVAEPGAWEGLLDHLVEQAHGQLARRTVQTVTLRLESVGDGVGNGVGEQCARRLLREPTASLAALKAAIHQTCANLLRSTARQRRSQSVQAWGLAARTSATMDLAADSGPEPEFIASPQAVGAITAVEVGLGALTYPSPTQPNLFTPPPRSLKSALRSLEARFPGVMQRGVALDPTLTQEAGGGWPEAAFQLVPLSAADLEEAPSTKKLPPKPSLRRFKRSRAKQTKRATQHSPFKNAAPRKAS